ncbi:MAG: glycosyltransferase family 2 protein [Chloroflexota bacterium]
MAVEAALGVLSTSSLATPTWSILIVHYANVDALLTCLTALAQQVAPEDEILVVDNQGSPAVTALVSGVAQARLLTPGRNLGYGAGNNLAAATARGRYVMILNPDVAPRPAFLRHMAAALDGLPELALVTATLLLPDGRVNALGNDVTYAGITTCRGLGQRHVPGGVYPVPAISGAALALRRSAFHTLGGFDEQFFLYLEDTDLALRARLRGGSCWCAGDAVAVHDYRWRFSPTKQLELEKNRLQLVLKVYRRETLLALLPGLLLVELCTIAYAALRGPAFLQAKLRAYVLLFEDRHGLRSRRRRLQAERLVDDDVVLVTCRWRIPFRQQLGPLVGTAVEWLLAPAFYLPFTAARALARYQARPRRWATALLT